MADAKGPEMCFDLETVPFNAPMVGGEFDPKWAKRAEGMGMDPEDMAALHPGLCQIAGIGFLLEGKEAMARFFGDKEKGADYATERELVEGFVQLCQKQRVHRFGTFNGGHFDWPVLLNRCAILGIPVPSTMYRAAIEYRYRPDLHMDVMDLVTLFGAGTRWSLDTYALAYLGEQKASDGAQVRRMWETHEYDKLREYAAKDADITWRIYQKWAGEIGLPGGG